MTRWEYTEAFYSFPEVWGTRLDELGADGWELVAIVPDEDDFHRCVLKRPLEEDDGETDG